MQPPVTIGEARIMSKVTKEPDWLAIQGHIMRQLMELVLKLMEENKRMRRRRHAV